MIFLKQYVGSVRGNGILSETKCFKCQWHEMNIQQRWVSNVDNCIAIIYIPG